MPNYPSLPFPQMPRVGKTRMTMDSTKILRKGTSWSTRLDKRTNNVITQNTVGCGGPPRRVERLAGEGIPIHVL